MNEKFWMRKEMENVFIDTVNIVFFFSLVFPSFWCVKWMGWTIRPTTIINLIKENSASGVAKGWLEGLPVVNGFFFYSPPNTNLFIIFIFAD